MTTAIIQARMSSTRLPGKVLLDLAGQPMLARVVERARRARTIDRVIVATTVEPEDEPIVRITSDCPLIDPEVIDRVVERLGAARSAEPANVAVFDYASNINPRRTFPRGLDVEVFTFAALWTAWRDDREPTGREHVTPFLYRHPDRFRIALVESERPEAANHRWSVDTPEDYELMRRIYSHFGRREFNWLDVLDLLDQHPDWCEMNRHVEQKPH